MLGKVPGTRCRYGDVERHSENVPVPHIIVIRPESGLFFADAEHVRHALRPQSGAD